MSSMARPGGRHGAEVRPPTDPGPIRVLVADHHALVRLGLRKLLDRERGLVVMGEADDAARLVAGCGDGCDVVVLDVSLPGASRVELLARLRARWPGLAVVVTSAYADDPRAARLVAEGAAAYVSKDRPPEDLVTAIRAVHGGRRWTGGGPGGAPDDDAARCPPHHALSAREYQVFTLLYQGHTVSEIAAELELHGSTVSNHLARIKDKLAARSIADVVGYAHRAGLAPGGGGPP